MEKGGKSAFHSNLNKVLKQELKSVGGLQFLGFGSIFNASDQIDFIVDKLVTRPTRLYNLTPQQHLSKHLLDKKINASKKASRKRHVQLTSVFESHTHWQHTSGVEVCLFSLGNRAYLKDIAQNLSDVCGQPFSKNQIHTLGQHIKYDSVKSANGWKLVKVLNFSESI